MITIVNELPEISVCSMEWIKIKSLFDSYKNDNSVIFWAQDFNKAIISFCDGNMVIFNNQKNAELNEIKKFINVISPCSVFSNYETLCKLGLKPENRLNVMYRYSDISGAVQKDNLSSKEIYNLLYNKGLLLPDYPSFAVDYCRRLNKELAGYFGLKDKCAAVYFIADNYVIIVGIASCYKGYGTIALTSVLKENYKKHILLCCVDNVKDFYKKNGFNLHYYAGCWVK